MGTIRHLLFLAAAEVVVNQRQKHRIDTLKFGGFDSRHSVKNMNENLTDANLTYLPSYWRPG
jgi:hypothetical protein